MLELAKRPIIAVLLFMFGMGLIPLNDLLIKLMSDHLSIFQIMACRAAFSFAMVLLIPSLLPALFRLSLRTMLRLVFRGYCLVSAMLLFFLPLATLGLAEVTAIFFTAPLIISLLSVPLLGEKLGIYRIAALIVGLIGILLIVQPGGSKFQLAYLMPIGSAISYAAFQLVTRYLRDETELLAMVGVQHLCYLTAGLIGGALIFLLQPEIPDGKVWQFMLRPWQMPMLIEVVFFAIGAFATLNLSVVSANVYRNVEATIVAPFEYTALPMAILWSVLFLGEWPDQWTWAGMALILAGGIFMIYRENRRDTEIASAVPMRSAATNMVSLGDPVDENELKPLPVCF